MRLRLHMANKLGHKVFSKKSKLEAEPVSDDSMESDETTLTPSSAGASARTPERWHRVEIKMDAKEDSSVCESQFPRSFGLEFPEEPFASIPETPVNKATSKEPVWKKRLRYQGKSPSTDGSLAIAKQDRRGPPRGNESGDRSGTDLKQAKIFSKTVSFDEAGIKAVSEKTRKNKSLRQKQKKILEAFDEEQSFDQLMRNDSGYSDVFLDLFEEDDFSLATPNIYTDESSAESSYLSRNRKPEEEEEEEEEDDDEDDEEDDTVEDLVVRHSECRKNSRSIPSVRSISPEGDLIDDDFFGFASAGGCQSVALLEELDMITELFIPGQRCICADPEPPRRGRHHRGRRHSRRSRSHD